LVEGFDYQIVIDPVDFAGVLGAIGLDCDLTEMDSIGHQLPADVIAGPPSLFESLVSDFQEIESHLPGSNSINPEPNIPRVFRSAPTL